MIDGSARNRAGQMTQNSPVVDWAELLAAARDGDAGAFTSLTEPHRRELTTHCYRMLGSLQDAEDMVQETYLRAWRRLDTYEGRASFRAWLYKISTNACLDLLERRPKRTLPAGRSASGDPSTPPQPPVTDPIWIEPFPDELLAPSETNPEARYDAHESISLAFLVALQALPPRQRSVLILDDVLDWTAEEISGILGISLSAVNSLLYRARSTLKQRYPAGRRVSSDSALVDDRMKQLLEQYLQAWESADIEGIVSMLKEDAAFPMPPMPVWYQGREAIRAFISATILAGDARGRWRLMPVRANGRHGFAFYRLDETSQKYTPFAIQVLSFQGDLLEDVTTFGYPFLFPAFGLPAEINS